MDVLDWHAAATSSVDRMAAIAAGDISLVVGLGNIHCQMESIESLRDRQQRLLRFVFSNQYLSLRDRLGIRVK
jgi:calcineurin-like phosphoesterase